MRIVARGPVVAALLLVHLVWWAGGWLALLAALRPKPARQRWFARRLVGLLRALGATFVKVGQIMSTRPDLLPPHVIEALETLQDQVGAFAFRHVRRQIVEDFGAPPDALFASFDPVPIASASVSQVHRARLRDGRAVAVKVRRPGLDAIVRFDLAVMRAIARVLAIAPSIRLMSPVESVGEFARAIHMQIDFRVEAANNRRFRANFGGHPDVRFPELVPELCSARVLTMEFIDGRKVLDYDPAVSDPRRLARIGFHTLLKMVFADGFVHADLHPGNILVTPDDRVVIIDLGLVAELDDLHRRIFAQYFAAWAAGDATTMARIMVEFSPSAKVGDYAAFERDVVAFVDRYYGKALGEVEASKVAFDMMGVMRRHRVRANPTFTMVNIAIAVTEGIGKQLAPDLDLMSEAAPFFAAVELGPAVVRGDDAGGGARAARSHSG
ncbi:MAG: AarF/ABC1/UbiB kinase family protein [Deltaproteobacteria bacterium]|nr:MAG: AarF/ABC1/UbiB kinase family protein [Deltaproteobacteria bacterium]